MPFSEHSTDLDTGISYNASTPNLQKLLNKVQARKRAVGEEPDRGGLLLNYRGMKSRAGATPGDSGGASDLSARLDHLIQFDVKNLLTRKAIGEVGSHALYGGLGFGKVGVGSLAGVTGIAALRGYEKEDPEDPGRKQGLKGAVQSALSWKTAGGAAGTGALLGGALKARKYLSAKLDLIELAERPMPMVKSVWRKLRSGTQPTKALAPGTMAWRIKLANALRGVKASTELSSMLDVLINFADPRPRNNLGEFAPAQEGAPDPNAMVKTYRIAPQTPGISPDKKGFAGLAGLALVGGAAGTIGSEAVKGGGKGIAHIYKKLRGLK